jgi:hypothetical protein
MKTEKDTLTEADLWAAYDAHKEDLAHIGDLYAEAKRDGDRTRANRLLEYSRTLRRAFYDLLERHLDSLPVDLQNALIALKRRSDAAAA